MGNYNHRRFELEYQCKEPLYDFFEEKGTKVFLITKNDKNSYRVPAPQTEFEGELVLNAPSNMYKGLGKNNQKLYIIPSKGLVIIRLGETVGN